MGSSDGLCKCYRVIISQRLIPQMLPQLLKLPTHILEKRGIRIRLLASMETSSSQSSEHPSRPRAGSLPGAGHTLTAGTTELSFLSKLSLSGLFLILCHHLDVFSWVVFHCLPLERQQQICRGCTTFAWGFPDDNFMTGLFPLLVYCTAFLSIFICTPKNHRHWLMKMQTSFPPPILASFFPKREIEVLSQ